MKPLFLLLTAGSLVVMPVLVVKASHRVAAEVGTQVGGLAAEWLRPITQSLASAPQAESLVGSPAVALVEPSFTEGSAAENSTSPPPPGALGAPRGEKRQPARARPAEARGGGLRVSARQVLSLAERRAMPRAVAVPADGRHPAGLKLLNVSGLGVGMRDGDILTRVAGAPALSTGAVVELVLRARARQAPEISAEFWRNGARWSLVVEQPYLTRGSAPRDIE